MVDDTLLDLSAAAASAGLSSDDLKVLVASGRIAAIDDCVANAVIAACIDEDRATRRLGLLSLAAGVGDEVYY